MGNRARQIIDLIQNLMLDRLFVALLPLWWVAWAWSMSHPQDPVVLFSVMFGFVTMIAVVWMIGALANRRPKPRPTGPNPVLERLQTEPSNGFEAWAQSPEGGPRPPRPLRRLILLAGKPSPMERWSWLITVPASLGLVGIVGTLGFNVDQHYFRFARLFADQDLRDQIQLAASIGLVLLFMRKWAKEQRDRLLIQ